MNKNKFLRPTLFIIGTLTLIVALTLIFRGIFLSAIKDNKVESSDRDLENNNPLGTIGKETFFESTEINLNFFNITSANNLNEKWISILTADNKIISTLTNDRLNIKYFLDENSTQERIYTDKSLSYVKDKTDLVLIYPDNDFIYLAKTSSEIVDYYYADTEKSFYILVKSGNTFTLAYTDLNLKLLTISKLPENLLNPKFLTANKNESIFVDGKNCLQFDYSKTVLTSIKCDGYLNNISTKIDFVGFESITQDFEDILYLNDQELLKIKNTDIKFVSIVFNKIYMVLVEYNELYKPEDELLAEYDISSKTIKYIDTKFPSFNEKEIFVINNSYYLINDQIEIDNIFKLINSENIASYPSYPISYYEQSNWSELKLLNVEIIEAEVLN